MRTKIVAALAAALLALPLCAETVVIRNATIMTVTHGTVKGSIVVKDGKIADVGEKVMEPAGASIIDAGGSTSSPASSIAIRILRWMAASTRAAFRSRPWWISR